MKKMAEKRYAFCSGLLCAGVLGFLLIHFGPYIQDASYDLVQHFLLIDELVKHGAVRPGALERIGAMALYPPGAHWMAVVVGWVGGSGLVGMTFVAITSLFVCYLMILRLAGGSATWHVILFCAAFFLLSSTHSLVGWEVVHNFFYPQLVADALYFVLLLWLSRNRSLLLQGGAVLVLGAITMWIQPLVAIHIFGAGCALLAFQVTQAWMTGRRAAIAPAACLVLVAVVSVAIIMVHPAFRVMRLISANDGALDFGYSHILRVALACAALGALNLWRYRRGGGSYVDAVVGSAVLASASLLTLQFALLRFHGDGSDYAVKKHMFIVFTLGAMNAIRLVVGYLQRTASTASMGSGYGPALLIPLAAGAMCFPVLHGWKAPVSPILNAMTYANHAATLEMPGFEAASTVVDDASLPLIARVMITLTGFQHPFDPTAVSWQQGADMIVGAKFAMVRRTPKIEKQCDQRMAESGIYVIVEPSCLRRYVLSDTLSFTNHGTGWPYVSDGWSSPEPWGAWTLGDIGASLVLSIVDRGKGPYRLVVEGSAWLPSAHRTQRVLVEVNEKQAAAWDFDQSAPLQRNAIIIPEEWVQHDSLRIVLKSPGAVSPLQLGMSSDPRVLGIGVKSVTLCAISDESPRCTVPGQSGIVKN